MRFLGVFFHYQQVLLTIFYIFFNLLLIIS